MLDNIIVQVLDKVTCPHHQATTRNSTMGSFSTPSSLLYLHEEREAPRTPESSIKRTVPTPSAPRKPARPPSNSGYNCMPYPSAATLLSPIREMASTRKGFASHEASDQSIFEDGNSVVQRKPARVSATIEPVLSFDAPEIFLDDDLTLLSYGPSLVIALDDQLFLCRPGETQIEMFTCTEDGKPISCVQWSPRIGQTDKSLLALGLENKVQIWSVDRGGALLEFEGHSGFVSAIGWNPDGTELVVSSNAGVFRYNMLADIPNSASNYIQYHGGEGSFCLRWSSKNLIASAGNGMIYLWDAKHKGKAHKPVMTLPHTGVRCLEFCPDSRRNHLVSGGDGGVHFWNIETGLLRASINTDAPVTAIVWSAANEIMLAHGDRLSIWKLGSPKLWRICQLETGGGNILSMDQGLDGRIACLHEKETCKVYSISGNSRMAHQCNGSMRKDTPIDNS